MHPVIRAAIGCTVLSLGSALGPPPRVDAPPVSSPAPPRERRVPCEGRSIPEGAACVPLLDAKEPLAPARGRTRSTSEDAPVPVIPRRPDRPAEVAAYRFPIAGEITLLRSFDDELERTDVPRGMRGVEIAALRGTEVKSVELEAQTGPAEVIAIAEVVGKTVIMRHRVAEGAREKSYLVFYGRLDAIAPDVVVGSSMKEGDPLGFTGDSGSPGELMLYLEIRAVREDIDLGPLEIERLADASVSVSIDARNVLPLAR
jgi:murein DD-endopeptidase MepM/ murein hydrolase activator NlpD